jgi:nitrosocyanin
MFRTLLTFVFLFTVAASSAVRSAQAQGREMTLINVKYQGKVIWLPSVLVVKKGEKVKLTLINNVPDDPDVHGFSIPEFGVKADVLRGTPHMVEFIASKAGLFETNCHLHPAHLPGQLLVIEK